MNANEFGEVRGGGHAAGNIFWPTIRCGNEAILIGIAGRATSTDHQTCGKAGVWPELRQQTNSDCITLPDLV